MWAPLNYLAGEWHVVADAPVIYFLNLAAGLVLIHLAYRARIGFLKEELAFARDRLKALAADDDVAVRINAPKHRATVGPRVTVDIAVKPPGWTVQLLVRAPDGRWFPQGPPRARGRRHWRCEAFVGDETTAGGTAFVLVALAGAPPVADPTRELPADGVRSREVVVLR